MKKYFLLLLIIICSLGHSRAGNISIDSIFNSLHNELKTVNEEYQLHSNIIQQRLHSIKYQLSYATITSDEKVELLIEMKSMEDSMTALTEQYGTDVSKVRYKKGVEIIKLLNEKMLSLDHHFSTVRTFNEISNMANPNSYPDFVKMKDQLKLQAEKRIPKSSGVARKNVFASLISSFVNMLGGNKDQENKTKQLDEVSCIIDFTLRMYQDLNTIFYETTFLQNTNAKIKDDLDALFKDYVKVLGINQSLKECRDGDDWDKINEDLDAYLLTLSTERSKNSNSVKASKMQVNLEFCIDRLLQFITSYNNYINQCVQYYNKFKVVLDNYENQKQCDNKLPAEYKKLKDDIGISIEKFNTAYSTVELNGSKMKELLYGLADNN